MLWFSWAVTTGSHRGPHKLLYLLKEARTEEKQNIFKPGKTKFACLKTLIINIPSTNCLNLNLKKKFSFSVNFGATHDALFRTESEINLKD